MTLGGKRKLVVPSRMGYGKRGSSPDIPPNATLHFDITMKKIVKGVE
jgi:FK506-binding nuclear protein